MHIIRATPAIRVGMALASFGPSAALAQTPTLEFQYVLPSADAVFFGEVTDADVWPDGWVAVYDNLSHQIAIFDADGAFVHGIGRSGQGPGEIGDAAELEIGPDGTIALLDYRNRRITVWDRSGTMLRESPLRTAIGNSGGWWPHDLIWNRGGLFLKISQFAPDRPVHILRLAAEFNAPPDTVATVTADGDDAVTCVFCAVMVSSGGRVLASQGDTLYRIHELGRDGTLLATWQRDDLPATLRTAEEMERLFQAGAGRLAREGARGRPSIPPHRFRFEPRSLGIDARDRLWLRPTLPDDEPVIFDVYSLDGQARLGSIVADGPLQGMVVRGNTLLGFAESDLGEPIVKVYRIR